MSPARHVTSRSRPSPRLARVNDLALLDLEVPGGPGAPQIAVAVEPARRRAAPGRTAQQPGASDAELMRRVQGDDAVAFQVLYGRFAGRAHRVARAVVHDHARAEDVVQEAFLAVWRARGQFDVARGPVGPWLLGTVRHRAIDALRADSRHDRRTAQGADPAETAPAGAEDLEASVVERDEAARLRRLLQLLPPAQRDVIAFAYFGELSASEIAAELHVPIGTIKGRMRLGLEKLRA